MKNCVNGIKTDGRIVSVILNNAQLSEPLSVVVVWLCIGKIICILISFYSFEFNVLAQFQTTSQAAKGEWKGVGCENVWNLAIAVEGDVVFQGGVSYTDDFFFLFSSSLLN